MTVKDLQRAYDYSYWANEKLFQVLSELTAEEFTRLVSKHEQAEQALREKEAVYKSLIESLPLNVFRKDLQGRFRHTGELGQTGARQVCRLASRLEEPAPVLDSPGVTG